MLLAYLLLYRSHPLTSEMLSVVFWPDASPKSARNRLHVVMNGLRKDLAEITNMPIVVFRRGYLLNPDFTIDLDTERFERIVEESLKLEAAGNRLGAVAGLQEAVALYRGPLLNDSPYEEWAWGLREHYHVSALRALDHLAGLLFEIGSYNECLEVCERVLIADLCREDIHRLAMRCYSRLNQPHLAARQFQNYRRQLSHEFGLLPDKATLELADKIRRREPI
jgi:DNA-binding SARP family transcriptional activator